MTKVVIRNNVLDDSQDQEFDVVRVGEFLYEHFKTWPTTAKLYQDEVCAECLIPLEDENDVRKLNDLQGTIYVVIEPAGLAAAGIALIGATVGITAMAGKKGGSSKSNDTEEEREIPEKSPTNKLTDRSNRARLNERIPDIFGTVIATPDLIAQPYKYYVNNEVYEHSYLCVSRGKCLIEDVRDGEGSNQTLQGMNYKVFDPFTSPNFGMPVEEFGTIDIPFIQTELKDGSNTSLPAFNEDNFSALATRILTQTSSSEYYPTFESPWDEFTAHPKYYFDDYHPVGSQIEITAELGQFPIWKVKSWVWWSPGFNYGAWLPFEYELYANVDLTGVYTIERSWKVYKANKYTNRWISLENPKNVNADWAVIEAIWPHLLTTTQQQSYPSTDKYVFFTDPPGTGRVLFYEEQGPDRKAGPFFFDAEDTGILANVTANGGLYKDEEIDDGQGGTTQQQSALSIEIKLVFQELDADDDPVGDEVVVSQYITGSDTYRNDIRQSWFLDIPDPIKGNRGSVYLIRETLKQNLENGSSQEDIALEAFYITRPITEDHFGDITTIQALVKGQYTETSYDNRNLNCKASRIIPVRQEDATYVNDTTSRFADIARAICLDPKIGNRKLKELDIENFYAVQDEIETYFGTPLAGEFNYAFDDNDLSFEETIAILAEAVFCTGYRQGNIIRFILEKLNQNSRILFNHRNKLPNSEVRSVNFGYLDDYDGVDIEYASKKDGAKINFYLPSDQSATNPREISQLGLTNSIQAYFHAHRRWNIQRYQNTIVNFEATQEASMLAINDRILVSDNTRTKTFDGEVVAQNGTTLTLSQDFEFEDGKSYTIFLQNADGTIHSTSISEGPNTNQVILAVDTSVPLALDLDLYARATYEIVENSSPRRQAFLVKEKNPTRNQSIAINAVNYDERYYTNDLDYVNDIILDDGTLANDYALRFDQTQDSWFQFPPIPGGTTLINVQLDLWVSEATFILLTHSGGTNRWCFLSDSGTGSTMNASAGSPLLYVDGELRSPSTAPECRTELAKSKWITVKIENLNVSSWDDIGNKYAGLETFKLTGWMKNFKVDWDQSGEWDAESTHANRNGFTTENTVLEKM